MRMELATLKAHVERPGVRHGRYKDGETSSHCNHNYRPYNKINFPIFSDGDPRGWILKAEKYFHYYNIPDEEKVDVASMYLKGDALDLFSWLNPDEYLCGIRKTGTTQEYRQDFAKRSSRVSNWPAHCLLGVFLHGLMEELKADHRLHKPRSVYKAMSIALEFESKTTHNRKETKSQATETTKPSLPTTTSAVMQTSAPPLRISKTEKHARYIKGECFRYGEKYGPGHRCKTGTFKLLEYAEENITEVAITEQEPLAELAEISLQSTCSFWSAKPDNYEASGCFRQYRNSDLGNGDVIRCNQVCKEVSLHISDLQVSQYFYPFALGGADAVLGIQWLTTPDTVQAN
ncbi:hypothetical protein L1987_47174 [Smallanthus sonchifolius]|uniref:Uncharacterized protein n=1 Tax=Smallanthus sonchifolius TaxID=185202 RepID=A0ACB9G1G4_9ASTR|nr:hypothetical protein L1987_47174 [Smallanthus sonchifolius]